MKKLFIAMGLAAALAGCASRVILTEDMPGATVVYGTTISYEKKEKKVSTMRNATENTALALSSTTIGSVASLAYGMFNRLSEGPYMELRFRPDDGSPDELLPFRVGSPIDAQPGDRIKIIHLNGDSTAYNLTGIERWKAGQTDQSAAKK